MISEEELIAWLNDEKRESIQMEINGTHDYYLKVPRTDQVIFLFHKSNFYGDKVSRNSVLRYAGFYNKTDNSIYDSDLCLMALFPNHAKRIQVGELYCQINTEVRKAVEERVENDMENLSAQVLDEENREKLLFFEKIYLRGEVRKLYLLDVQSEEVKYECWYECNEGNNDDTLFAYLENPDKFVQAEAKSYIAEHQADILYGIKFAEMKKGALQTMEAEVDGRLPRIKRIMAAVGESGAQSVKVTVNKNGEEFTFKTLAHKLKRDSYDYYSAYDIEAKDRIAFTEKFGRGANYAPEEIVDISYRGKSIYSAQPYEPEESEATGMLPVQA